MFICNLSTSPLSEMAGVFYVPLRNREGVISGENEVTRRSCRDSNSQTCHHELGALLTGLPPDPSVNYMFNFNSFTLAPLGF